MFKKERYKYAYALSCAESDRIASCGSRVNCYLVLSAVRTYIGVRDADAGRRKCTGIYPETVDLL